MTEPLLDLDTLIVRPTIEIDGTRYEILSPEELGVIDNRRFALWAQQLNDLQQGEEVPEALADLVDTVARKVLVGVPDAVFAKLSGTQRIKVVEVFTALLLRAKMGVAGAVRSAMGNPSTGASWFPGLPDFTEARRDSGWRARLSRWFALS